MSAPRRPQRGRAITQGWWRRDPPDVFAAVPGHPGPHCRRPTRARPVGHPAASEALLASRQVKTVRPAKRPCPEAGRALRLPQTALTRRMALAGAPHLSQTALTRCRAHLWRERLADPECPSPPAWHRHLPTPTNPHPPPDRTASPTPDGTASPIPCAFTPHPTGAPRLPRRPEPAILTGVFRLLRASVTRRSSGVFRLLGGVRRPLSRRGDFVSPRRSSSAIG